HHRAVRAAAAARVRRAGAADEPVIGLLFLLIQGGDGWAVAPSRPTVGDTIRLERTVSALPGWRIRAGRLASGSVAEPLSDVEVPDARWLAAGEPKAVAARVAQRLRFALAHAIPEAHAALSTEECLAAVERARPDAPLRDLRELLLALDQVAFATAHGVEIAPLAARARALARELGNGARR